MKNQTITVALLAMMLSMTCSQAHADGDDADTNLPPQNPAGCLDLAAYLNQIRALPDSMFVHHQLVDLTLKPTDDDAKVSDLAYQHALNLFYHPDLVTLGLAAAKNGGNSLHIFTAYQLDCAKVVTGDIFAAEGRSVIWEVDEKSPASLTLKRLTPGGEAEISNDLSLVVRNFQVLSPTMFGVMSVYALTTTHPCKAPMAAAEEKDIVLVTDVYTIDNSKADPKDPSSDDLKALIAKYPRTKAASGHRGPFAHPVTAQNDPVCSASPASGPASLVAPRAPGIK